MPCWHLNTKAGRQPCTIVAYSIFFKPPWEAYPSFYAWCRIQISPCYNSTEKAHLFGTFPGLPVLVNMEMRHKQLSSMKHPHNAFPGQSNIVHRFAWHWLTTDLWSHSRTRRVPLPTQPITTIMQAPLHYGTNGACVGARQHIVRQCCTGIRHIVFTMAHSCPFAQ